MKHLKTIFPYALMIIALIIWWFLGEGHGHKDQSNAYDYLACGLFVGGLILIVKKHWL